MARGQRKFDTVGDKDLGVEVQVFIITDGDNRGQFSANYADRDFREKTFEELRKKLSAWITESSTLTWFPILEVKTNREKGSGRWDSTKLGFSIEFERYYVCKRPDGSFLRCKWDVDEQHRLVNASEHKITDHGHGKRPDRAVDFTSLPDKANPYHYRWSGSSDEEEKRETHFLDYDEALFQGLEYIGGQVLKLEEKLREIIGTRKGRDLLISQGVRLLPEKTA